MSIKRECNWICRLPIKRLQELRKLRRRKSLSPSLQKSTKPKTRKWKKSPRRKSLLLLPLLRQL